MRFGAECHVRRLDVEDRQISRAVFERFDLAIEISARLSGHPHVFHTIVVGPGKRLADRIPRSAWPYRAEDELCGFRARRRCGTRPAQGGHDREARKASHGKTAWI